MTPLKQGIAYLINAARPGPTPPLVGTGQPGSNADMRARLTGLFGAPLVAMLSAPGIALAVHVPAPDPSQGDGGVSSFYDWLGEVPDTPGQMLRTEPLDPASGLEMAGEQDQDVRRPSSLRRFGTPALRRRWWRRISTAGLATARRSMRR